MLVTGRAAAQQTQRFSAGVPQLVLLTRWNGHGIAGFYLAHFLFDAHPPRTVRDEINLFGPGMIMLLCARARWQTRLRQTLIANRGIAVSEQFTNLRAIFRNERRDFSKVLYIHGLMFGRTCGEGEPKLGPAAAPERITVPRVA